MGLQWNGEAAKRRIRKASDDGLIRLCEEVKRQLKKEVDRPFPPASKPGEYPRRRTGRLQTSIRRTPIRETAGARLVSVVYGAFYGKILVAKGRLGPADLMRKMREYFRAFNARGRQVRR